MGSSLSRTGGSEDPHWLQWKINMCCVWLAGICEDDLSEKHSLVMCGLVREMSLVNSTSFINILMSPFHTT